MNTFRLTLLALTVSAGVFGQPAPREPMRGTKRGAPQPAQPTLVIGVNAAIGTRAEPGWPLIVSATKRPDDTPVSPPLPSELRVRVTAENGTAVSLAFVPVPPPASPEAEPSRGWIAAETETARLAPGRYRVTVGAETGAISGWRIEPGEIVLEAPRADNHGLALLRVQRALLQGRLDEALAEANRGLTATPGDLQLWVAKGDVLMRQDDPDAALEAFDRALSLHRAAKTEGEPLALAQRRRGALMRGLEKRGVVAPTAPP